MAMEVIGCTQAWCMRGSTSRFMVLDVRMKVVCGALRDDKPTLEKEVIEGPHGIL